MGIRAVLHALTLGAAGLLTACVTLTADPRGVSLADDGALKVAAIACVPGPPPVPGDAAALDPKQLRILTWNIHKQEDDGWDADLARFVADADLVLLQEAVLRPDLRAVLDARRLRYAMASAFLYRDLDHGVVTAAAVPPLAICAERGSEPLIGIPKTALVAWYPLTGQSETLAVVNLHAVNFSLSLAPYEEQFAALSRVLTGHRGPIVFAGDFNAWSDGRRAVVERVAGELGLHEVAFDPDRRARFLGRQIDYVMVRGLDVVASTATEVRSSDHNPVAVTLRVPAPR